MNYSVYDKMYLTESVKETKYGYDTGIKVKGKSINVHIYKGAPTKEDIESNIDLIKSRAKVIVEHWNEILNEAAEKHKNYNNEYDSIEKAKKALTYDGISLMCGKTVGKADSFEVYFSSKVMDKDGHGMFVELYVSDDKFKINHITIEG